MEETNRFNGILVKIWHQQTAQINRSFSYLRFSCVYVWKATVCCRFSIKNTKYFIDSTIISNKLITPNTTTIIILVVVIIIKYYHNSHNPSHKSLLYLMLIELSETHLKFNNYSENPTELDNKWMNEIKILNYIIIIYKLNYRKCNYICIFPHITLQCNVT